MERDPQRFALINAALALPEVESQVDRVLKMELGV